MILTLMRVFLCLLIYLFFVLKNLSLTLIKNLRTSNYSNSIFFFIKTVKTVYFLQKNSNNRNQNEHFTINWFSVPKFLFLLADPQNPLKTLLKWGKNLWLVFFTKKCTAECFYSFPWFFPNDRTYPPVPNPSLGFVSRSDTAQ